MDFNINDSVALKSNPKQVGIIETIDTTNKRFKNLVCFNATPERYHKQWLSDNELIYSKKRAN